MQPRGHRLALQRRHQVPCEVEDGRAVSRIESASTPRTGLSGSVCYSSTCSHEAMRDHSRLKEPLAKERPYPIEVHGINNDLRPRPTFITFLVSLAFSTFISAVTELLEIRACMVHKQD